MRNFYILYSIDIKSVKRFHLKAFHIAKLLLLWTGRLKTAKVTALFHI